jgi:KDO2-lipid IV(A) lauroyltransferase
MNTLIYYLTVPIIYLVSLLPFKLLYLLSDGLYLLVYVLLGYRKKVVAQNLKNAFPNYNSSELLALEKRFYRFFCDMVLESFKTLTISEKSLKRHVSFTGNGVFEKCKAQDQSVVVVMGHQGNWEFAGAIFSLEKTHQLYIIYHPLKNKRFDKMMYNMRSRLGNKLYSMKGTARGMISNKGQLTATAFLADQTPPSKGAYWTTFLNQDTPVFTGTAKLAKKFNYPVVYASVKRTKRGQYDVSIEMLVEDPRSLSEDTISELHTKRLEEDILACPEIWLWSHRRWKHKRV